MLDNFWMIQQMVINMDKKKRLLFLIIFSFIIDFISKRVAIYFLSEKESSVLIPRFFSFTLAKNTGGAFSILSDNVPIIIILSLFIIYILFSALKKDGYNNFELVCYSLIIGGAFGNLFDRVFYGYVVDFLDFYIFGYDYPVFNFADIFIVVGIIGLFIDGFRKGDGR